MKLKELVKGKVYKVGCFNKHYTFLKIDNENDPWWGEPSLKMLSEFGLSTYVKLSALKEEI